MSTIRPATLADIERLLPLVEAYWAHDGVPGFEAARLRVQLVDFLSDSRAGSLWLAMQEDTAVGYLACCLIYSFEHGGWMAEVDELFVVEAHRGAGLGRQLLATAGKALSDQGCRYLQLQVADGNTAAQAWYANLGFHEKSGYRLWLGKPR